MFGMRQISVIQEVLSKLLNINKSLKTRKIQITVILVMSQVTHVFKTFQSNVSRTSKTKATFEENGR